MINISREIIAESTKPSVYTQISPNPPSRPWVAYRCARIPSSCLRHQTRSPKTTSNLSSLLLSLPPPSIHLFPISLSLILICDPCSSPSFPLLPDSGLSPCGSSTGVSTLPIPYPITCSHRPGPILNTEEERMRCLSGQFSCVATHHVLIPTPTSSHATAVPRYRLLVIEMCVSRYKVQFADLASLSYSLRCSGLAGSPQ